MKHKKRLLSLLLSICLVLTMLPLGSLPALAENGTLAGDGTQENPYQIADAEDLKAFRNLVNGGDNDAWAVLTADIVLNEGDLSGYDGTSANTWEPWTPIGGEDIPYTGTFDGGGYTISGLYINDPSAYYQGLFGYVGSGATVENVGVENSYISAGDYVGGVAGWNDGTIQICYNTGTVITADTAYVGGVVGDNDGTVQNCYNTGAVTGGYSARVGGVVGSNSEIVQTSYNIGPITGGNETFTGGVVGGNYGIVQTSYNTGKVAGGGSTGWMTYTSIGGVVGFNDYNRTVQSCYNIGVVTGDVNVGGVVGSGSGTIQTSYYLEGTASASIGDSSGSAESKTQAEMQSADFVAQLNGDLDPAPWQRDYNASGSYYNGQYPILDWQAPFAGGTGASGDPFLIATKEDLTYFASLANGGKTGLWGTLVDNIDLNPGFTFASDGSYTGPEGTQPEAWNTICSTNDDPRYNGTFDGNGYTISGVYINTSGDCKGLFGHIGSNGVVRNLRVENSSVYSNGNSVGGIVAINRGRVENCIFTGWAGGNQRIGGIAGRNRGGTIQNCYNIGTVQGNSYVNGVAGDNTTGATGTVKNCFTTAGNITNSGTIINSYFMSNTSSAAGALTVKEMTGPDAVTTMNLDSSIWTPGGDPQWEETELNETGQINVLYAYLPHPSVFDGKQNFDRVEIDGVMHIQTDSETRKTYYLICDAEQLNTFRNIVNGTLTAEEAQFYTPDASANGRLMENIDLNPGYTFAVDGSNAYSGSGEAPGVQSWTPMGSGSHPYTGTFDGNGYTISGVYINTTADGQGLFGYVGNGGTVQNLGVINSFVSGGTYVGGVAGRNYGGTIQNCYNAGFVTGSVQYVGGVTGYNRIGMVQNCYNIGSVTGTKCVGGVAGENHRDGGSRMKNCFNAGSVSGELYVGSVSGYSIINGAITNCYYLEGTAAVGIGHAGSNADNTVALSAEEMTGPDAMENMIFTDSSAWKAGDDTTFWKDTGTLDKNGQRIFGLMAQLPQLIAFEAHEAIQVDTTLSDLTIETDSDGKIYYLISTKEELELFRDIVNGTLSAEQQVFYPEGASANGRLVNDIDLNPGYTFAVDGTYTYTGEGEGPGVQSWTPIGDYDEEWVEYTGTFDGNEKTIRGIYIKDGEAYYQGLFGYINDNGKVTSLGVENSYISANDYVGGVAGNNDGNIQDCYNAGNVNVSDEDGYVGGMTGDNDGSIQDCYNTGTISAIGEYAFAGGIAGDNDGTIQNSYNTGTISVSGEESWAGGIAGENDDIIQNCYNTGAISVNGNDSYVGGVVGYNDDTIQNCYNTGTISVNGNDSYVGGVAGYSYGTVTNCYYLKDTASTGIGDNDGESDSTISLTVAEIEDVNGLRAKLVAGLSAEEENPWNEELSAVGTWESGKPAVQPVFTWQTPIQNTPTYTVTIPTTAAVSGDTVTISADAEALRANQEVVVAVDAANNFALTNGGTDSVNYQLFVGDSTAAVNAGEAVLTAANTGEETKQVSIRFGLSSTPVYAGTYTGTCTFAVSVKERASE